MKLSRTPQLGQSEYSVPSQNICSLSLPSCWEHLTACKYRQGLGSNAVRVSTASARFVANRKWRRLACNVSITASADQFPPALDMLMLCCKSQAAWECPLIIQDNTKISPSSVSAHEPHVGLTRSGSHHALCHLFRATTSGHRSFCFLRIASMQCNVHAYIPRFFTIRWNIYCNQPIPTAHYCSVPRNM